MLTAATDAEAREHLSTLPHDCGDTSFAPPLMRSHDAQGLWLVFRGACPRCWKQREVRFLTRPAQPASSPVRSAAVSPPQPRAQHEFDVLGGNREERDLYGTAEEKDCDACEGKGEYFGVTGDYATGMVTCGHCRGTGRVR